MVGSYQVGVQWHAQQLASNMHPSWRDAGRLVLDDHRRIWSVSRGLFHAPRYLPNALACGESQNSDVSVSFHIALAMSLAMSHWQAVEELACGAVARLRREQSLEVRPSGGQVGVFCEQSRSARLTQLLTTCGSDPTPLGGNRGVWTC